MPKRPSVEKLLDDEGTTFEGADVVHFDDVRVSEGAHQPRLVLEPPQLAIRWRC